MSSEKSKKDGESVVGDVLRKVISVGVGAAFMTEEMVKNVLGELPLPKDIISGLIQNAKNTKEEFVHSVRDELGSYLKKVDIRNLLEEVLQDYDIDVDAKIRFNKKNKKKES